MEKRKRLHTWIESESFEFRVLQRTEGGITVEGFSERQLSSREGRSVQREKAQHSTRTCTRGKHAMLMPPLSERLPSAQQRTLPLPSQEGRYTSRVRPCMLQS